MKRWATIIFLSTSWCIEATAQIPSNAGNIFGSSVVFDNPTGITYAQGIEGMVGMQWLYAGIAGDNLRNNFAYFIYPLSESNAFGLRAIHFNSNLLQQGTFSLLFGQKFFNERLSVGVNANLLYYAYDKDKFVNFMEGDPVIAKGTAKNALSFGAGVLLWLSEMLACGFSVDDLNRPDISLNNSGFKKEPVYKIGAIYLHPWLAPQFDVQIDDRDVLFQAGVHRSFLEKALDLFAGYSAIGAEGQALFFEISFMPGPVGMSYNFRHELGELGQVSSGSHFLTLRFNKDGPPKVFAKPIINLLAKPGPAINSEALTIAGDVNSRDGITRVEFFKNGKVDTVFFYAQELKTAPFMYSMKLTEGPNEIEIVAHAGKQHSSKKFSTTYAPEVLPPRITIFSSVVAEVDTPSYHLHAKIDDPRGLQKFRILVNGEARKDSLTAERPSSVEINEPIFLTAERNEIVIFAANDKKDIVEQAVITYRQKPPMPARPAFRFFSPQRPKIGASVTRVECEVQNVESAKNIWLKVNGVRRELTESEVVQSSQNSFFISKVVDFIEGPNRIEVSALNRGNSNAEEFRIVYDPLLNKKLYRKTWAIIIGIDSYQEVEGLKYAVNDAKGVERLLRELFKFDHFITIYEHHATRDRIMAALSDSLKRTGEDDGVFVFFAGHGATDTTRQGLRGFIVPYDGKRGSYARNISMDQIKETAIRPKAKNIFYVMDACFSGTIFRRSIAPQPSAKPNYARVLELASQPSRNVLTAGDAGQEVLDGGSEKHSIFTRRFLEGLRGAADFDQDGYITASEISDYVMKTVPDDAIGLGFKQNPHYGKLTADAGQFVFVSKNQ